MLHFHAWPIKSFPQMILRHLSSFADEHICGWQNTKTWEKTGSLSLCLEQSFPISWKYLFQTLYEQEVNFYCPKSLGLWCLSVTTARVILICSDSQAGVLAHSMPTSFLFVSLDALSILLHLLEGRPILMVSISTLPPPPQPLFPIGLNW